MRPVPFTMTSGQELSRVYLPLPTLNKVPAAHPSQSFSRANPGRRANLRDDPHDGPLAKSKAAGHLKSKLDAKFRRGFSMLSLNLLLRDQSCSQRKGTLVRCESGWTDPMLFGGSEHWPPALAALWPTAAADQFRGWSGHETDPGTLTRLFRPKKLVSFTT